MRMTIDIDHDLMMKAMNATGQSTKKATAETALRTMVTIAGQKAALEELRGSGWEGDLDVMRRDRSPDAGWALEDEK